MKNMSYDKFLDSIVNYLDNNYTLKISLSDKRDRLRHYLTKYFIVMPNELATQLNYILQFEINQNPILDLKPHKQLSFIKHDITQIKTDAIVNAANSDGVGCFEYGHKCIDNVIHNKAGPNLRMECQTILANTKLPTSAAIITSGYNLLSKYVIHTVGPIYQKELHQQCSNQLAMCYTNCLQLADKNKLSTIVFCCISTGLYGFPANAAAEIAINSTKKYLQQTKSLIDVIFCTYSQNDFDIYQNLFEKLKF